MLLVVNLKPEEEVILPGFTFWVDAAMVVLAGLRPVFVDVDFSTANIDPYKIEENITEGTKVIFLTHLNGLPADMRPIMDIAKRYNLRVIEDCARSCGVMYKDRRVGSFDIGIFSFGYAKNLYLFGGGMVTSDDESFIKQIRILTSKFKRISINNFILQIMKGYILKWSNIPLIYRFYLFPLVYQYQFQGRYASLFKVMKPSYNNVPDNFWVGMNNVQAEQGIRYLKRIDMVNNKRVKNSKILKQALSNIPGLHIFNDTKTSYCAVWSERKRGLQKFLFNSKIDASDESAVDITRIDKFKIYSKGRKFPNADLLNGKIIFLPTHPYLSYKDMRYIIDRVKIFHKT